MTRVIFVCLTLLVSHVSMAFADTLYRIDGKTFEGKLISQDSKKVIFELHRLGQKAVLEFPRDVVSKVVRSDAPIPKQPSALEILKKLNLPEEPVAPPVVSQRGSSYYLIPLRGEVGATVLASLLDRSLADAALRKPTVVVLDIESPGGLVNEAERIIAVIRKHNKKQRVVAMIGKTLSAAAIFTLAVKEIYVKESGIIGAATAYRPGRAGLPPILEEKIQSTWRAVARGSAQSGGHEPLLAEAMIDNDLELQLVTVGGKKFVKTGAGERMLCRKGKILTLTAYDAVECGLAAGIANDPAELGKALGHEGWSECKGVGTILADFWPKRLEKIETEMKKITAALAQNLDRASKAHPDGFAYGRLPASPPGTPIYTAQARVKWHERSLACVEYLKQAEQNLRDAISLAEAVKEQAGLIVALKDAQIELAALRQRIFEDRDKFGAGAR